MVSWLAVVVVAVVGGESYVVGYNVLLSQKVTSFMEGTFPMESLVG